MQNWDYEQFKNGIYKISGINLSAYKERQMKRRIDSLMKRCGYDNYNDYYFAIRNDNEVYNRFINHLTINVSEFYRNPLQWSKLEKDIIPMLLKLDRPLAFWSAACSTGEEPYSLVMLLSKYLDFDEIKILATDIDEDALDKASQGIYSLKSLDNLPEEFIDKFFVKKDERYLVKNHVKNCVEFRKLNLIGDKYPVGCSLILCRNAMIYFTDDIKREMYNKFYNSLLPGGILFVGSTEQIINCSLYGFRSLKNFFYMKI